MHNAALSWEQAGYLTAALAALAMILTAGLVPRPAWSAPLAREATVISALYTVWQLAGELSVAGTGGALNRAGWIERTERAWQLPAEVEVQRAFLHHAWLIHAADIYYAVMHFGVLFVFLFWLFLRHRDRYPKVRRVLALTTLACLVIQLLPVAPPRMLPGYVDTAAVHGESVYGLGFGADALSAMPSVHVAWAVLIAVAVHRIGSGPARWLGVLHAVLTVFVVVVTANHFWADGMVAVVVLACCALVVEAATRAVSRLRTPPAPERTPVRVPVGS